MTRLKKIFLTSLATSLMVGGISLQAFSSKLSTTNSSAKNPVTTQLGDSSRSIQLAQPFTANYPALCVASCTVSHASNAKKNKVQNSQDDKKQGSNAYRSFHRSPSPHASVKASR